MKSASADHMSLLEEAIQLVTSIAREHGITVKDCLIGFRYAITIVRGIHGDEAGLAYVDPLDAFSSAPLYECPNHDTVSELLLSTDMLGKILGLSYINAVSQYMLWRLGYIDRFSLIEGNLAKVLRDLATDVGCRKAVVVGGMDPLVRILKEVCSDVVVVERCPLLRAGGAVIDTLIHRAAKGCDLALVTGAAIVNETLESVLTAVREAKLRIVVGPTAGIYPELLLNRGVDYVASTRVIDIENAVKRIKLGGGRREIAEFCRDYIVGSKRR